MPISVELLDDYHKENDFTIVVGQNILLKFVPNAQVPLVQRPNLKNVLNISDLPSGKELALIKDIVKGTKELKAVLGTYVRDWSSAQLANLPDLKQRVISISDAIIEKERQINISVCDRHYLSFCSGCSAYIGEIDTLVTKCSDCNVSLTDHDKIVVSYLDNITNTYLDGGTWFEDYIEKLLVSQGWKVWTHGSVMGASGVLHPIDFLAVKNDRVLIGECKTGDVSTRDISHFFIQKIDIPSHFGLFLSMQKCSTKSTASLFKVSTSALIDSIEEKTDQEIIGLVSGHVEKFS